MQKTNDLWLTAGLAVAIAVLLGWADDVRSQDRQDTIVQQDLNLDGWVDDLDVDLLQRSLGRCDTDAGFDARADLNRDGCVNILDVQLANQRGPVGGGGGVAGGGTEIVEIDTPVLELTHGGSGSVLFLIRDNTTPLFGYSLDVNIVASGDLTRSSVIADVIQTNFFEERNLIIAGGAPMDPLFSVILEQADGGVFVSANTVLIWDTHFLTF